MNAPNGPLATNAPPATHRSLLRAHLEIARPDHWVKNVFVLPGIAVALSIDKTAISTTRPTNVLIGLLAVCLVASSNYVLNELLDAPSDRHHPTKSTRPVPSGEVNIPLAYVEWLLLMLAGAGLGLVVSRNLAATLVALWVMGCLYNIPPARTKDVPYLDVLSEAVNNPLRMIAGWYITGTAILAPMSLLISYWMVGCYFMAIKRFAEFREIEDSRIIIAYRKSFAFYTEPRLLISIMFYGCNAMLFFGAFLMRYRMELILSFPFVALVMAIYLAMAFKKESAAEAPEKLYREPALMSSVILCAIVMTVLLFVNVPFIYRLFPPSVSN